MTLYEYDGDRLVASATVKEAEFSPSDVAALLASRRTEAEPRNAFGVLLSEATDRESRYRWSAEPVTDFVVETVHKKKNALIHGDPEADPTEWVWSVTHD